MIRSTRIAVAAAAALFSLAGSVQAGGVVALPGTPIVTPAMRAQQTANLLRNTPLLKRNDFYNVVQQRGGSLLVAEMPLVIGGQGALDPGADPDPTEIELMPGRGGGAPIGVFYRPDAEESDQLVYNGYSLTTGASISRTQAQLLSRSEGYLLIEDNGSTELRRMIDETNAEIRRRLGAMFFAPGSTSLTKDAAAAMSGKLASAIGGALAKGGAGPITDPGTFNTSVIHSIRVDDRIYEVGKAEPYGIVAGLELIPGTNPQQWVPSVRYVGMEYMTERYETYLPGDEVGQEFVLWGHELDGVMNWKLAPYVSMLVMEKDSDHSYQELFETVFEEVGKVAAEASGQAIAGTIGEAMSNIVSKLPEDWFVNDDDYLDVFYSLMHNIDFKGHGASNNVHLHTMTWNFGANAGDIAPDLVAAGVVAQAGSYFPHQKLSASFAFKNEGNLATGPWQAKFYLQPVGPGPSIQIGTGNGPSLAAGQTHYDEVELSFGSAPAGSYRLRVEGVVDNDADPTNNSRVSIASAPIALIAGQAPGGFFVGPDLEASYIISVPGTYYPSDTVETWFGVDNDGSNAGQWRAHFWAVHTLTGKVTYLATGTAGSLASGGSYGGIVDLPLTGLSMGQHRLVLQVAGLQGEQSTANNIVQSIGTIEIEQSLTDL